MKIVAIDEKNSSTHWTAFSVDTPITREVADQFRELYAQRPDAHSLKVRVQYSLVFIQAALLPDNFIDIVSQVLSQAENTVSQKNQAPPQTEQRMDVEKLDVQKHCEKAESPDHEMTIQC